MKSFFALAFIFLFSFSYAQETEKDSAKKKRYGIVLIPTASPSSSGLMIGPIGSESICVFPITKRVME